MRLPILLFASLLAFPPQLFAQPGALYPSFEQSGIGVTTESMAQTFCGSGIPTGSAIKFGLPHNVIAYLNGGNGYETNVSGLYRLANDVLGGVN